MIPSINNPTRSSDTASDMALRIASVLSVFPVGSAPYKLTPYKREDETYISCILSFCTDNLTWYTKKQGLIIWVLTGLVCQKDDLNSWSFRIWSWWSSEVDGLAGDEYPMKTWWRMMKVASSSKFIGLYRWSAVVVGVCLIQEMKELRVYVYIYTHIKRVYMYRNVLWCHEIKIWTWKE